MKADERTPYVLVTPARNEEKYIGETLRSVVAQAALPEKWVIVNDGSTDGTEEIVRRFARQHAWIELVSLPEIRERDFASKVSCFYEGFARLAGVSYEVIGNLDADISFDSDYLGFLMSKFRELPDLGVAGTPFRESGAYSSMSDSFEGGNHVAGGCQLFRRKCFQEIGGYKPNAQGGIDWIAVTTARMMGWRTQSFPEKYFNHLRSLGTAQNGKWASSFNYGRKDYYLGNHPLWEMFRLVYRMTKPPYVAGSLLLLFGYLWEWSQGAERPISRELLQFHRREELAKLKSIFLNLISRNRMDAQALKYRVEGR